MMHRMVMLGCAQHTPRLVLFSSRVHIALIVFLFAAFSSNGVEGRHRTGTTTFTAPKTTSASRLGPSARGILTHCCCPKTLSYGTCGHRPTLGVDQLLSRLGRKTPRVHSPYQEPHQRCLRYAPWSRRPGLPSLPRSRQRISHAHKQLCGENERE